MPKVGVYGGVGIWKSKALTDEQAATMEVPDVAALEFQVTAIVKFLDQVKANLQLVPGAAK